MPWCRLMTVVVAAVASLAVIFAKVSVRLDGVRLTSPPLRLLPSDPANRSHPVAPSAPC